MALWRRFLLLLVALAATCSFAVAEDAVASAPAPAGPIQAKTNHILVETEAEADEVLAHLQKSQRILVDFAKTAIKQSKCPSSSKGGSLGWIERGRMVPEFDAIVFDKEPGQLYKVKTQFGWHVVYTIRLGNPQDEQPDESSWSYQFKVLLNKAAPFLSPVLLIVIFFFGSRNTIKLDGPKARASHILVKTEAEADALLKEITKAADPKAKLAELAKTKSSCPSGRKGGDLGLFGKGQMVPAFEKIAFEKEVGSVHKVETQFGWHLVMVNERIGDKKEEKKEDKRNN